MIVRGRRTKAAGGKSDIEEDGRRMVGRHVGWCCWFRADMVDSGFF